MSRGEAIDSHRERRPPRKSSRPRTPSSSNGAEPTLPLENDKPTVLALREIAAGNVTAEMLREPEPSPDAMVPDADNQSSFRAPQFGLGE